MNKGSKNGLLHKAGMICKIYQGGNYLSNDKSIIIGLIVQNYVFFMTDAI